MSTCDRWTIHYRFTAHCVVIFRIAPSLRAFSMMFCSGYRSRCQMQRSRRNYVCYWWTKCNWKVALSSTEVCDKLSDMFHQRRCQLSWQGACYTCSGVYAEGYHIQLEADCCFSFFRGISKTWSVLELHQKNYCSFGVRWIENRAVPDLLLGNPTGAGFHGSGPP